MGTIVVDSRESEEERWKGSGKADRQFVKCVSNMEIVEGGIMGNLRVLRRGPTARMV